MWGELASEQYIIGNVIAFKACRVSEYSGRSLNASADKSDTVFNVKHPSVKKLLTWFESATVEQHHDRLKFLSERQGAAAQGDKQTKVENNFCSIAEMMSWAQDDE